MDSDDHSVKRISHCRPGFWAQLAEISSSPRWSDVFVFALILGIGGFQFFYVERARDFLHDDVFFADSARSLISHGFYGINGYPETNMPPGVPSILALLCIAGGCSHSIFLRAMVVFATLAFLVSYELLRRQIPRLIAAAICLLLISSRIHFELVTQVVSPCYPYFFTAMTALLIARELDKATGPGSRIGWAALLTALIAVSLMFASAGIAFLGAIVAAAGAMFFWSRHLGLARLIPYLAALLVGIVVEGVWMHQPLEASAGIAANEWSVPGFPQSYLSQLRVKDGRHPEAGMATLQDIPVRILKNAYERCNLLSQLLLQRWIYLAWMSVVTVGVFLLIVLGWCYSVWLKRGGLQEWYFAGYEFIYLLWPWDLEPRFFLPVAPLACLYLWRGGQALVVLAKNKPRVLGLVWFPMALYLTVNAWFWMHGVGTASQLPHAGLQDEVSFVVWLVSAIFAAWVAFAGTAWLKPVSSLFSLFSRPIGSLGDDPLRILRLLGIALLVGLIGKGLQTQLLVGRANLDVYSDTNRSPADVEAGAWVRLHTDATAVVMARQVPTVFHYSNRKVIWFPPSSNPQLLIEGILKHKIDFVLVVRRAYNYYLPPDDDSFAPLLNAYHDAFRLVYQVPEFRVYQFVATANSVRKFALCAAIEASLSRKLLANEVF
jgi:hypothetical protein